MKSLSSACLLGSIVFMSVTLLSMPRANASLSRDCSTMISIDREVISWQMTYLEANSHKSSKSLSKRFSQQRRSLKAALRPISLFEQVPPVAYSSSMSKLELSIKNYLAESKSIAKSDLTLEVVERGEQLLTLTYSRLLSSASSAASISNCELN